MTQKTIQDVFNVYLSKQPIISNKQALTISYTPNDVPHRNEQINQLGTILAPALRAERPSNVFIYGATGTGKTLVTQYVTSELLKMANQLQKKLTVLYVNCKMKRVADTEYRLLAFLSQELGKEVPPTGLPTDQVYNIFFNALEQHSGNVVLVIDEIDSLIKKVGDELLYNLTRINQTSKNTKITVIGISNDLSFTDFLDARVRSSLSEEELVFPPYNAMQLKDILTERTKIAFNEGKISEGVIAKCAALAAQEHGDARRALDLLRVAAELAERNNEQTVTEKYVDMAEAKVDTDKTLEAVKTQPKQSKLILYATLRRIQGEQVKALTGDIFDDYLSLCKKVGVKPLTQRRFSDIIAEMDIMGIINARVISQGRYGRTREIRSGVSTKIQQQIEQFLKEEFFF